MTDTSGYRTAVGSPVATSPSLAKVGPSLRQRKPKVTLPKDDFGVSHMMAIIELAGLQDKPSPPEPVHPVDEMLFGRPIQMDELHPAIREIYAPTFKQLNEMDQASAIPRDPLRVHPDLFCLCANNRCSTISSSKRLHLEKYMSLSAILPSYNAFIYRSIDLSLVTYFCYPLNMYCVRHIPC